MEVVSMRLVKDHPDPPGPGWKKTDCPICWRKCWTNQQKELISKSPGYQLMCTECAAKLTMEDGSRTCPECGEVFKDAPAISRKDGKEICPECGTKEALTAAGWDPLEPMFGRVLKAIYGKKEKPAI